MQYDGTEDMVERPQSNRLRGQRKQTQPKKLAKREINSAGYESSTTEPHIQTPVVLRAEAREFIHSSQMNAGALGLRVQAKEFVPSYRR